MHLLINGQKEKIMNILDETLAKIADEINEKRRRELFDFFYSYDNPIKNYINELRKSEIYKKGSKSKVWKMVALIPPEVDRFFSRIYGADYYKQKDFFDKFPEWKV